MTPEEKHLLEQTYKMTEENNKILRSIRNSNRIGVVFRVIYWIVIIGASIGAFYFIQPYINSLTDTIGDFKGGISGVKSASANINELLR